MNLAELIAQNFHATYETLAPEHGYETRKASAVAWDNVPDNNKALMIATVQNMLDMGVINPGPLARRIVTRVADGSATTSCCGNTPSGDNAPYSGEAS